MNNPPNARFWHWHRDSVVKITLKPGQVLHHQSGGPDEEGWSRSGNTWSHDGDTVTWEWCDDGFDCDGRLTRGGALVCALTELQADCREQEQEGEGMAIPDWTEQNRWQRDHAAEAMGY
ncbi:hypothetical protein CCR95_20540 [Thiocystis minor]|uniref:hypothetical protein n=1 Tax=Thiocystis minor TaxID=61597 RepID=UPI0019115D36|nr:hypothetical protein [Thiocystis minor]MBK5966406.1 hypothetical protein [Thiocystis minor]